MTQRSILIVEDESIVALDLKLQLQKLGYLVVGIANSGESAIELAAQLLPHLILMDVRLQGQIDGIEAAATIRRSHDIPVIFLTSHSDDDTVQRAATTAPYGYLTKPYQIREIRAGIEVALTKASMERQLRGADRWFAKTLQCVADGVIVTDLNARVLFINPAAESLTGWNINDVVGQAVSDVVCLRDMGREVDSKGPPAPPRPLKNSAAMVKAALTTGRPLPVEYGVKLAAQGGASTVVDVTAGPVNQDDGQPLGAVLMLRDTTERLAHEALLRASEERFSAAFDHAPLGMALVSFAGELIQVNDALCQLLGASADELKTRTSESLSLGANNEHEAQRLHDLMSSPHGVVQFEKRFFHFGGSDPVWALVSVSLMREGDTSGCYLYQVHDLTEQKMAAERIAELAAERMRRQASELAGEAKNDFLSRLSHEMRTPLNAVIGFAELLEMPNAAPERIEKFAQYIREAGEHLLHLVTDLLDLNRITQGTLTIVPEPIELADAVNDALKLLEGLRQAREVELATSIPPELIVRADRVRLCQVLLNVGSNAIKYNRQGGSVQFLAGEGSAGRIKLAIKDTGLGMTREQLGQLFQPFNRLGMERSKISGVGLGMAIARSLTVEMGGTMNVESLPGAGTTVTLELLALNNGQLRMGA